MDETLVELESMLTEAQTSVKNFGLLGLQGASEATLLKPGVRLHGTVKEGGYRFYRLQACGAPYFHRSSALCEQRPSERHPTSASPRARDKSLLSTPSPND